MATSREVADGLLAIAEKYDLDPHERETIQLGAHRIAPTKRRIALDEDPIQAIRNGTVTTHQQALAAYNEAVRRAYGQPDQTIVGREYQQALIRSRLLVRREFDGDALRTATFLVRAVAWFKSRQRQDRWPGNQGDPTFDKITHAKILRAFRQGEIDREVR